MANKQRTELQIQADQTDRDLFRTLNRLELLAERAPAAASALRALASELSVTRIAVRELMHPADREVTQ